MFNITLQNGKKEPFSTERALELIAQSNKFMYRYGFAYRGAKEHEISRAQAQYQVKDSWTDMHVDADGTVHINQYSENDMY